MKMRPFLTEFRLSDFYLFQACSDTPSVKHFAKKLFTLEANLFLFN